MTILKFWVIAAFVIVVAAGYALFYIFDSFEAQGASAFSLANTIGLITVVVGILVAGAVMRRTSRP